MGFFERIFSAFLYLILPKKIWLFLESRKKRIKNAFTSTRELKIFWYILFMPIRIVFDLFAAILKSIVFLFIDQELYGEYRYALSQLKTDLVVKNLGFKLGLKRFYLTIKLFVKGAEKRVSYGEENPDKIFYVIRPYYYVAPNELLTHPQHLLFYYYVILQKISYAINNKWIPVVDFENYEGLLYFAEPEPVHGTKNAWEYFWEQPSPYTLDEVYRSKNVILSVRNSKDYGFIPPTLMKRPFDNYANQIAKRCQDYARYTRFEKTTQEYIDKWVDELFPKDKRILGVVYRSTSYGKEKTPNSSHPMQPSLEALIDKIKNKVQETNMDYIYFVNEEVENVEFMKSEFGDKLIVLPRNRYSHFHEFSENDPNPLYVYGQRYPTNLSYLTEIALLSKCTGLLGAMSSGTRAAIIWNNNQYEFMDIIDLGLW